MAVTVLVPPGSRQRFEVWPQRVKVSIRGRAELLKDLNKDDVVAFVDCASLDTGASYELPVRVSAGPGLTASGVEPPTAKVTAGSILNCVSAGIRTLEHGNLLDEKAAMAIRDAGAYLVPTLVTYEMISRLGKSLGIPDNNVRKINEAKERGLEALAIAHRAGCKIASGSDLLGPMQVYKGLELELKARVLGAMGAIVATTKTNAELLKKEKELGTIAPGKARRFDPRQRRSFKGHQDLPAIPGKNQRHHPGRPGLQKYPLK